MPGRTRRSEFSSHSLLAPLLALVFGLSGYVAVKSGEEALLSDNPLTRAYAAEKQNEVGLIGIGKDQQDREARAWALDQLKAMGESSVVTPELEETWLKLLEALVARGASVQPWSKGVLISGTVLTPSLDGDWLTLGSPQDELAWRFIHGAKSVQPLSTERVRTELSPMSGLFFDAQGKIRYILMGEAYPESPGWFVPTQAANFSDAAIIVDPATKAVRIYLHLSAGNLSREPKILFDWLQDQQENGSHVLFLSTYGYQVDGEPDVPLRAGK